MTPGLHDLMGYRFLSHEGRQAVCRCGLLLVGVDGDHAKERHAAHAKRERDKAAAEIGLAEARAALEGGAE